MNINQMKRAMLSLSLIALLFASTAALAQNTADNSSSKQDTPKSDKKSPDANDQKEVITQEPAPDQPWYANSGGAYTVSLGTGQLISLYPQVRNDQTIPNGEYVEGQQSVSLKSKDYRYQMFYGLSADTVYTNSIGGVNVNPDLLSTSVSPYLAVFMPTKTGRFLLQYSAVVNPNDTQSGGPQAYHSLTFSALGSFSDRWYWTAATSGNYGSESARLQGPLPFLVVQSTPIVDTTSTAVLLNAKNVAFTDSSVGLGWLRSRRDKIYINAFHVYTGIEGDPGVPTSFGTHTNSVGARLEYVRTLTPRLDLRSYGEGETVLNGPTCNTFGGGIGLGYKATHQVEIDVRGGPQWSTASCGSPVSANFSASIVKNFGNQDKIYAMVSRQFTTIAQLNSRFEDTATVGFEKAVRRMTFITDAGYLRGDAVTIAFPAYKGYFVAPRVRYKLSKAFGLSAGYRGYHGTGGGLTSGNLSYAVAGIEWYPAPLHF